MTSTPFSPSRRFALSCGAALALGSTALAQARARPPLSSSTDGPALATVYSGQVDPSLCLVSEKYDGVRATWDGRTLRHRSGRPVSAPASFLSTLPPSPLDGELWLGRGRFDALSATVRRVEPREDEWSAVRYMVFELPGAPGPFVERADRIAAVVGGARAPQVQCAPQRRLVDRAALDRALADVVGAGGEGLVLHLASAPYVGGRSDALMKLKPHLDAEATVVGYRPGAGRNASLVGALEVESADGRRFLVGSGLSDALRRSPPEIGSVITYRHRDLTPAGLPRFATYLRRHETFERQKEKAAELGHNRALRSFRASHEASPCHLRYHLRRPDPRRLRCRQRHLVVVQRAARAARVPHRLEPADPHGQAEDEGKSATAPPRRPSGPSATPRRSCARAPEPEAATAARRSYFSGSATKPIRVRPAFCTVPMSSATRP